MQARVKLPAGPLIEFLTLTQAIAEAICPTGERGLSGVECVTGKLVPGHYPIPDTAQWGSMPYEVAYQSELVSDDGRPLDQLINSEAQSIPVAAGQLSFGGGAPVPIHRFAYPYKLTDADRSELQKVLPQLPPLRYPMSEDERDAFMEAYCNLSNKPMWLPTLVTDETVNRLKGEQHAVLMGLQRALREAHKAGQISSVSAHYKPLAGMMAGTYIPREQATAYLGRHGLAFTDATTGGEKSALEPVSDESIQPIHEDGGAGEAQKRPIGASRHTPKERAAAVALCRSLKAAGPEDFVKQVAEKYGVSRRTVSNWVEKAKEEEAEMQKARRPASVFSQGS